MTTRTIGKTPALRRSFALSRLRVPTYSVDTDEALIPAVSFTAYRRTGT
jgi:hypothetical protein